MVLLNSENQKKSLVGFSLDYQLNCRDPVEDSHGEDKPHVEARLLEHTFEQLGL